MRIIAGKYKSRIIKVPNSKLVRPTTDKNKEAIFNYLNNIVDFNDIKVCDMYAGSGGLGFEALSRGAEQIHFVEKNFVIYKNLYENINTLDAEDNCKIFKMSSLRFSALEEHEKYELILADPPFFKNDIHEVVENIMANDFLAEDGILIIERSIQTKEEDIEYFNAEPIKRLGDSLIYQFQND